MGNIRAMAKDTENIVPTSRGSSFHAGPGQSSYIDVRSSFNRTITAEDAKLWVDRFDFNSGDFELGRQFSPDDPPEFESENPVVSPSDAYAEFMMALKKNEREI